MNFTSAEISAWLGSFFWPFFRIAAFIAIAPVFSTAAVPMRIRLATALLLTMAIAPLVPAVPPIDALSLGAVFIIAEQVLIGLAMGFALQIIFNTVINAGQIIGMQMGLGFAQMMDPQTGINVPVVSQFYNLMVILIFLALNGHLILIRVLVDSFQTMPISGDGLVVDRLWDLVNFGSWMFSGALMIALPAVSALLLINVAFAVMTRSAPQINIFAVGFNITLTMGFIVMALTLPTILPQITQLLDHGFDLARHIATGGP